MNKKILLAITLFAITASIVLIGMQFAGGLSVVVRPFTEGETDESAHNSDFVLFGGEKEEPVAENPESITDNEDGTFTILGTISSVFTDCVEEKTLDESGEIIINNETVTCDGGSFITIGATNIATASGNVADLDRIFNKHKSELNPGEKVSVTASKNEGDEDQYYSLNCETCSVEVATTETEGEDPNTPDPNTEETTEISGILTEIFTDCNERKVWQNKKIVISNDPITCDGGSYIVVDGKTIYTASGLVPAGQAYTKHDPSLLPGTTVNVTATLTDTETETYTLNCDGCDVDVSAVPDESDL